MKILKPLLFIALIAIFLTSCGSSVAPIVSTPIGNIDTLPLKAASLTDAQLKTWNSADLVSDTIPGMSVDKAYSEIIKSQKGKKVIVAVIDSGIDIEHEDLKNVIWVNKDEIPNNGKDDDNNGYIDDVHGWNFLGDIVGENMEYVRIIKNLEPRFKGKTEASVSATDQADFALYQKALAEFEEEKNKASANKTRYEGMLAQIKPAHAVIAKKVGKENYTKEDLAKIENPTEEEQKHIESLDRMLAYGDIPGVIKQLNGGVEYFGGRIDTHFNLNKNFRFVLGDDPDDINDTKYGNNDVDGPTKDEEDVRHGTHVAGIIAAERNNGIGMNGVANNVEIMVLRAVPDGDEYDKDVALAIRYAVDNGASVINASFGKYYSPHPEWVWDAIKYAGENDVLFVHASGNEGLNIDDMERYPCDQEGGTGPEITNSYISIGALNFKYGSELVAGFSNYGKSSVDAFAPGVKIWSTTQLDTYEYLQGTSMAAPAVTGVAAIIRSFYPNLSAGEVKQVLMSSGLSSKTPVILGGDEANTDNFNNISRSGKMVNLYNALIMASKTSK